MLRQVLLATTLLTTALAGCLTPPPEDLPVEDALKVANAGTGANATAADWFALDLTAGPDATLAGAWWTVPAGAAVEDRIAKEYWDEDRTVVPLEVAFLLPESAEDALQEWAFYVFTKEEGDLVPASMMIATPFTHREHGMETGESEVEVETLPFHVRLGNVEEGERIGIVVAARSAEPTPLRVGFRALPEDPAFEDEPAEDAASFLAARAGRAPLALTPSGAGTGFQAAWYLDMESAFLLPFGIEAWTPAVQIEGGIEPDARPFASVRDQTFSASFDSPGGHAMAFGFYFASQSVGQWSGQIDLRGEQVEGSGPVVESPAFSASLVTGFPFVAALADGEGPSQSRFHLDVHSANPTGFEVVLFEQIDLGAPLQTLLGEDGYAESGTYSGLLGGTSRVVVRPDGSDLHVLSQGGLSQVFVGVLPQA